MTVSEHKDEVVTDFYPYYQVYKDGRVHRFYELYGLVEVPPSPEDPETGVSSKDINITPDISARLYLPRNTAIDQKLPILVYYHGGGLVAGSAFFQIEHRYLNILVSESNCVGISVNYRLAPEHDLPTLYEDCWTALQWVASHADNNTGTDTRSINNEEAWIAKHGDLGRLFIGGDSAGGNIVYNMAVRAGIERLIGDVKITGAIYSCPFLLFPSTENLEQYLAYKLWKAICPPSEPGFDSPMVNPEKGPCLSGLGCSRMFLVAAEKDELVPRESGTRLAEAVKKSGWKGEVELMEVEGEGHCFQSAKPDTEKAKHVIKRMASFIQRN